MIIRATSGWINPLFYALKPIIPRQVQISLRRRLAQRKRSQHGSEWLIVEKAGEKPKGWNGWPDKKQFAFVLRHDVETQIGHDRSLQLRDLEERFGMRSSFNFVPERYQVSASVRGELASSGFEVGVHGLNHDGKLYQSAETFTERAHKINQYLSSWESVGFASPASHHVLEWNHILDISYDTSTFDTAPFEPQSDGVDTIFPFWVDANDGSGSGYTELPYTLTQDFYAFIILQEETPDIWKHKLDWIAQKGGMALLITHPDYMWFGDGKPSFQEYPVKLYEEFLAYVQDKYADQYWHALPKEVAAYCQQQSQPTAAQPKQGNNNLTLSAPVPA